MTCAADALTIHQLLGRIVYFHTLFIEPALRPATGHPQTEYMCCNHSAAPNTRTVEQLLVGTAWTAVVEVAATVPAHLRVCLQQTTDCCATCRVIEAGAAIAGAWAETEYRAYHGTTPAETLFRACGQAAATRLGRTFAAQHSAPCVVLDVATADPCPVLPTTEELPLTGELLGLWEDPTATTRQPVASWLNHCTGLDDIRRVLETRRTST
jgi:hypothetical protein